MPQGKCAFCGIWVTGGGTAFGKHSVACAACTPMAMAWLEKHGEAPPVAATAEQAPDDGE